MSPEFPKWKHHPQLAARLVQDPEEEMALGPEWSDKRVVMDVKPRCENCASLEDELITRTNKFNAAWAEIEARRDQLQCDLDSARAEADKLREENALARQAKKTKPVA
jgi:hypothetical protein